MRRLAFLLMFVLLVAPLVGSTAPNPITVGYAPGKSQVIQLVGGTVDGRWVPSEKLGHIGAGQWRLFGLTGTGPEMLAGPKQGDDTGSLIVTLKKPVPFDALAVHGGLVTQPRKGRLVKADGALHEAVTRLLQSRGVKVEKARVVQCVEVDLLGDGDPEWLVIATSRDTIAGLGPQRTDRDYALAAMAWVMPRGSRRGSALHLEPLHFEGKKPKDDLAQDFRWVGVADVEGKGRMVAALRSVYYEGGGMELVSFDGARVVTLVAEGWGL